MKIRIKLSKAISFILIGDFLIFIGIILFATLLLSFKITVLSVSIIFLFVGYSTRKKNQYLIFRSSKLALALLINTLSLLKLDYIQEYDKITVNKTRTEIRVGRVGILSILLFKFSDINSSKEKYIAGTLVKYQR